MCHLFHCNDSFLILRAMLNLTCDALALTSQRHHLRQNRIITQRSAFDRLIRGRKYRLLNLGVFAVADKDQVAVPRLRGHQVSHRACDNFCRLAVLRDGGQKVLQVGKHLGGGP
jgi:hypothetical protein